MAREEGVFSDKEKRLLYNVCFGTYWIARGFIVTALKIKEIEEERRQLLRALDRLGIELWPLWYLRLGFFDKVPEEILQFYANLPPEEVKRGEKYVEELSVIARYYVKQRKEQKRSKLFRWRK